MSEKPNYKDVVYQVAVDSLEEALDYIMEDEAIQQTTKGYAEYYMQNSLQFLRRFRRQNKEQLDE